MLYIVTLLLFLTFYISSLFATNAKDDLYMFCIIFGGVGLVASIITQLVRYSCQVDDIERINQKIRDKKVYKEESKELIAEFKIYLADSYPEHEKEIFKSIKPEELMAFMVKYPEIKANETLLELVKQIRQLVGNIYRCDRDINFIKKSINVRKRTIFLTSLPILPKIEFINEEQI